jgi:hypothetical protein
VFGAMMDVELVNDGPITILVDSKRREWLLSFPNHMNVPASFVKLDAS